jgi:predicted small secreted protein
MRPPIRWTLALIVALTLTGCNTMRGFGRDVERGGERVQDAAGNVQNKM